MESVAFRELGLVVLAILLKSTLKMLHGHIDLRLDAIHETKVTPGSLGGEAGSF